MFDIPIAYFVFNRPEHTKKSLEAIRKIAPKYLYVIADGPRLENFNDQVKCSEVRDIIRSVDWPCSVFTCYSDLNLGCRNRINSGLDWVFSKVTMAIILEDDCVPNEDFFMYCKELLIRYKDNCRIMCISGNNFDKANKSDASYFFSKYPHIWGWATWRRAWNLNDKSMSFWPQWRTTSEWRNFFPNSIERRYWSHYFDLMYKSKIDTWDYVWTANIWVNNGIAITPSVNLVANIGIGPDATHTYSASNIPGEPTRSILPLRHPSQLIVDSGKDRNTFKMVFNKENRFTLKFYLLEAVRKIASILHLDKK